SRAAADGGPRRGRGAGRVRGPGPGGGGAAGNPPRAREGGDLHPLRGAAPPQPGGAFRARDPGRHPERPVNRVLAIARNTVREAVRERLVLVLRLFGFALLIGSQALSPLALGEGRK